LSKLDQDSQCAATQAREMNKIRLDYAWQVFSFSADQRVKIFNYMLLAVGFLTNAVVAAVGYGLPYIAIAMCLSASLLLIMFALLDSRNQYFVDVSERVLGELEKTFVFVDQGKAGKSNEDVTQFQLLQPDPNAPLLARVSKHKYWLRGVIFFLAGVFAFAGGYFCLDKAGIAARAPSSNAGLQIMKAPRTG
jgi:hypothetical protein